MKTVKQFIRRFKWPLLAGLLLLGVWLLPLRGQVVVQTPAGQAAQPWPQINLSPAPLQPEKPLRITLRDRQPWANVLLTWNGAPFQPEAWKRIEKDEPPWEWQWTIPEPGPGGEIIFYTDCQQGCQERGRWRVGELAPPAPLPPRVPTKLGVVFPNPQRDWRGRSGWVVELTYARQHDQPYWGVDALAQRVVRDVRQGQRVIVRVDFAQGQALPPAGDEAALAEYLAYLQRLARDDRLQEVYALQLGSGYNAAGANSAAPDHPVTPEWAARLINGYGLAPERTDNAVQKVKNARPDLRILVGPIQPWSADQTGDIPYRISAPWLDYFNTLVARLDEAARAKSAAGQALILPDGFAVQAPGRPHAPGLTEPERAQEPRRDLHRPSWGQAQAGFRIYRDWLAIINSHESTRGLPLYITSTNTYTPDDPILPAQNYPPGWLQAAYQEVASQPQVRSLIWFLDYDGSGDRRWDGFSLSTGFGQMYEAARDFEELLAGE